MNIVYYNPLSIRQVMKFVYSMISHLIQEFYLSRWLYIMCYKITKKRLCSIWHLSSWVHWFFWVKQSILECGLQSDLHSFYRFALYFYNTVSHIMIGQTKEFWMGFLVRMIFLLKILKPEINFLFKLWLDFMNNFQGFWYNVNSTPLSKFPWSVFKR